MFLGFLYEYAGVLFYTLDTCRPKYSGTGTWLNFQIEINYHVSLQTFL